MQSANNFGEVLLIPGNVYQEALHNFFFVFCCMLILGYNRRYSKTSEQGHIGDGTFAHCREVVLSRKFSSKPIGKSLKTKKTNT